MLPANDVWSFRSATFLSRELSRLAWIALSFNIILYWKILSLSCGSYFAGHFLFPLIRGYPAFSW
jgi:hypothetical protein